MAARTLPEFCRSALLGELIAAELETSAATPADDPAPTPTERARRHLLAQCARELRSYHQTQANT